MRKRRRGSAKDSVRAAQVKQALEQPDAHTLQCTSSYCSEDGERRFSVQNFNFKVAAALSVRTKVRREPGCSRLRPTLPLGGELRSDVRLSPVLSMRCTCQRP